MRDLLDDVIRAQSGFVELRYHSKLYRDFTVRRGKLEGNTLRRRTGVGVRVLEQGTWGFASTGDLSRAAIAGAVDEARRAARASAAFRSAKIPDLPAVALARGDFEEPGIDDVLALPVAARIQLALETEAQTRASASRVNSATCTYREIYEEKIVRTTDGADARYRLVRPSLHVIAVAERDGQMQTAHESIGVTGGWDCLFRTAPERMAEIAASSAVDLLSAGYPEGGWSTVVLSPSIVGLLAHEAIGHTVEADFVLSGSAAAGKLGQRVASELVTLCDSGASEHHPGAGGSQAVDDEGVPTRRTVVIDRGVLTSYLHNRETAAHFGVEPTGNARAWEYADQPLIRMRNTYLEPGEHDVEAMIDGVDDGYLLEGPRNGQADATAEFTFGVARARRIRKGKVGELVRGVTITGNAFEVLGSVDAVSSEFKWDLGSGHCGKGQPAKVDAGGPWIRCRAMLSGVSGAGR